jgi:hypothetical protein
MRWSQLQSLIYNIWRDDLQLQIHCTGYPLSSSASVGRYWITLGKQVIWDVPKDFPGERKKGTYNPVASEITEVIRSYLDTPRDELMTRDFHEDRWGLIDIFRAADRRIGTKSLEKLAQSNPSAPAAIVLQVRLEKVS